MATRCYKLTTQGNTTRNYTLWGPGITHVATGDPNQDLCSDGYLHAYTDPNLAVLLNRRHANIQNPKLWLAYGSGVCKTDRGMKVGYRRLTTKHEIPLPVWTTNHRVAFAILCSLEVYKAPAYVVWAKGWLKGKDRSRQAAADAAAYAVAADAVAAAYAADAAAYAADAAAYAAADAAAYAAAAADAAAYADAAAINFTKLARKALKYT